MTVTPGRYCGFNWLQSHPFCPRCPPPLPQPGFSFLVPAAAIAGYNEKGRGEMTGKQNPKVTHRSTLHSCAGSSTSPHPHQLTHPESHTHTRAFIDWKVHTSTRDGTNATLPSGGKLSQRPTTPLIPHSGMRSHTHIHMHTVPHTHTLWLCFCVLSELMRKVPVPCG